jgi:hypothetical protein
LFTTCTSQPWFPDPLKGCDTDTFTLLTHPALSPEPVYAWAYPPPMTVFPAGQTA